MRYLVLVKTSNNKLESYLKNWNKKHTPEIEIISGPYITYQPVENHQSLIIIETESLGKAEQFCKNLPYTESIKLTPILDDKKTIEELDKYHQAKKKAEQDYKNAPIQTLEIGATNKLEITPIIDWQTDNKDLETETGVSYLIKTDETTILFDLALNPNETHPSPLLNNMTKLGIKMDEIDMIYITHKHGDHIGGGQWYKDSTFSPSGEQIPLGDIMVYTPVKMNYPGANPIHTPDPFILSKGVASIGTIPNAMFSYGYTPEMGLAVNVSGKGIVLIIGCGHQTLPRILERFSGLFDEPLYGIVGGLHYPVMGGPLELVGYYPHQHMGTGKVPWEPISVEELMGYVDVLKGYMPSLVALSPHDSSEFSINVFRDAFPEAFRELIVGTPIIL
jgi:7,8-dihydropterin-6-yl-methyl-4-(beta-D-ribofuranosyl)aminobenzene 5'-phosphate synthase